jgi:bacterioferritin-associated ferredoxin
MMTDDADIDRITKKTESVMDDIKELINIAAECPTCRKRFKEYLQSKNDKN